MYRIGQSSDIHKLVKDRKLILGGVEIKSEVGLLGHSDADALLHAIAEAQKLGGIAAFIDAEHALDPQYAKALGVNIDDLYEKVQIAREVWA